ncbi:hypothetical protein BC828DRAFT_282814 [Blastocladiella britannica]|nr:hypothetical protein BC828DRAFT_282814 [Blastocladiella britannica]
MARVASPTIVAASQDPTPAAAAAALQREREEKARLAVIRKQQERKAADAARRAREEAERKAAAAEAASAAMAAAAAAQGSSTPGKKRRLSMASDANHLDNVSGMTQATQPDTESDAEDEAEPEFDFAAAILTSIPTKLPVLTLDPTTAAATAPLRPIVPLDVTSSLGSFADNSSPAWILSSCRVILKALERNPPAPALPTAAGGGAPSPSLAPLTTYAGSLRPFETGDLMSDILDERAQVTAPQGPTAAAAPGPQRAMVGAPGFLPPGPPPSSTMPGVVGGRGSPLTSLPMLPPGMGPARMLPPPGTSSGPPPGLTGPVTGGDSGLGGAALYGGPDSSMSFITQRLTGAAPGLVKRPGTPGSAPPPGLEGLARTASPAPPGLPFSDPAIVSVRPTSANAAGRGPPPTTGDKTEAVLMQKLREALNSGSAGRGAAAPPPGFGLPLKPQARSQAAAGPPPPPPGIGAMATHQQAGLLLSPHMMRSDGIHPQPQLQSIRPAPDADDVVVVGRAATTASTVIAAAPSRPTIIWRPRRESGETANL